MKILALATTLLALPGATADIATADYTILVDAEDGIPNGRSSVKTNGQALLTPAFVQKIKTSAGIAPFTQDTGGVMVQTTFLKSTSDRHVDRLPPNEYGWRPAVPAGDHVGFYALNTNKDAHLDIEDTCIPIEKGTLIDFDGGSAHQTIVNGGVVHLLGPFHLESMKSVGVPQPGPCPDGSDPPCRPQGELPCPIPIDDEEEQACIGICQAAEQCYDERGGGGGRARTCRELEERACDCCGCCSYGGRNFRDLKVMQSLGSDLNALQGGLNTEKNEERGYGNPRSLHNPLTEKDIEDIMLHYPHRNIDADGGGHLEKPGLLSPDECDRLLEYLENNKIATEQSSKFNDIKGVKVLLDAEDLITVLGKEKTQDVLNFGYEAAGEVRPVLKIWINKIKNDGKHQEDFHTDWRSEKQKSTTLMVALNKKDDLISGGEVIYLSREGTEVVHREQGMGLAHSSEVFHAVPPFEGIRSTLFIILVSDLSLAHGDAYNLIEGTDLM